MHDEKFTVVGVLAPTGTPNDKTVFVHLDGFFQMSGHDKPLDEAVNRWREFNGLAKLSGEELETEVAKYAAAEEEPEAVEDVHDHHHDLPDIQKEVTAVLVRMKGSGFAVIQFQSELKEGFKAQAVNPVMQISWLMDNIVGNVRTMLVVLTGLIVIVSGVGIFVSIYNSMADRRREIAIMRALGAQRTAVFSIVLSESILLCIGGGLLGLLLGHGLVFAAAPIVASRSGILIDPLAFEPMELIVFPVLIVLASLVGFIPAMTAYRTDVAQTLGD